MHVKFETDLNLIENRPYPQNEWMNNYIAPGVVGSVGDALISVRLKHDEPDAPIRWKGGTVGIDAPLHGTQIADGQKMNKISQGGPPILFDSNWESGRNFKTAVGWIYQDVREIDKTVVPIMGETPDYSWNNKIATTNRAFVSGDKFTPLPGGYAPQPNTNLRGGAFPIISDGLNPDAPPSGYVPVNPIIGSGNGLSTNDYAYSQTRDRQGGLSPAIGASQTGYKPYSL